MQGDFRMQVMTLYDLLYSWKTHCDKAIRTLLLLSWGTEFIKSVCIYLWLVSGRIKKKYPPSHFLWKMKSFSTSILEVWWSFPKEPIQHITRALGVPCCPCVGLECFYLQFMDLIQIWARLNLNSVNVLEHFWTTEPVLPQNRNSVLCSCISSLGFLLIMLEFQIGQH